MLNLTPTMFWLVILIACVAAEAITVQLVSLWFAVGSLGALIAAGVGLGLTGQWVIFILLSIILLLLIRPMAARLLRTERDRTNADRIFGEKAVVIETIDNSAGTGQIRLLSQTWTARTVKDGVIVPEGSTVYVDGISGVKAMVVLTQEELGGCTI